MKSLGNNRGSVKSYQANPTSSRVRNAKAGSISVDKISKYFISETRHTSHEFDSPYKDYLTDQQPSYNDSASEDSDFKTPKLIKSRSKILDIKPSGSQRSKVTNKNGQNHSKLKGRQVTLTTMVEQQLEFTDTNTEHFQLALQLSESNQLAACALQNISDSQETQHKLSTAKITLEKFGFKSNKRATRDLNFEITSRPKNSKFRYIKPVLYLRTEVDRQVIIAEKISSMMATSAQPIQTTSLKHCLVSLFLQNMQCTGSNYFSKNNCENDSSETASVFYVGALNIAQNETTCGSLLKKWGSIPGREQSPLRDQNVHGVCGNYSGSNHSNSITTCISPDLFDSDDEGVSKMINNQLEKSIDTINQLKYLQMESSAMENSTVLPTSITSDCNLLKENKTKMAHCNVSDGGINHFESFEDDVELLSMSLSQRYNENCEIFEDHSDISLNMKSYKKQEKYIHQQTLRHKDDPRVSYHTCSVEKKLLNTSNKQEKNLTELCLEAYSDTFEGDVNVTAVMNHISNKEFTPGNSSTDITVNHSENDNTDHLFENNYNFEICDIENSTCEELCSSQKSNQNDQNVTDSIDDIHNYNKLINNTNFGFKGNDTTLLDQANCAEVTSANLNVTSYIQHMLSKQEYPSKVNDNNKHIADIFGHSSNIHDRNIDIPMNTDKTTYNVETFKVLCDSDFPQNKDSKEIFAMDHKRKDTSNQKGRNDEANECRTINDFPSTDSNTSGTRNRNFTETNTQHKEIAGESHLEETFSESICITDYSPEKFNKSIPFDNYKTEIIKPTALKSCRKLLTFSSPGVNKSNIYDESTINDEELNYSSLFISTPHRKFGKQRTPSPEISMLSNSVIDLASNNKQSTSCELYTRNSAQQQCLIPHGRVKELIEHCDITNTTSPTTPEGVLIKTRNITPMPDYDRMNTPTILCELEKVGVKNLKRHRGVQILKHIYDTTHPLIDEMGEYDRIIKRRRGFKYAQDLCGVGKKNDGITGQAIGTEAYNMDIVGDFSESEEVFFERRPFFKISCAVPLHIAWHNFLTCNPDIKENILLYEPLQLEVLYAMLKNEGYKYQIQDLLTFLDKKCVTIRINQNKKKLIKKNCN